MKTSPHTARLRFSVHTGLHDPKAKDETIVLIHGFPDGPAVWNETRDHLLNNGYRVVVVTLPGFEEDTLEFHRVSFDTLIDRLHSTLIDADALGGVILGHDWGAILSYRLLQRYPKSATRLICLEIGCAPRSLWLMVFVLLYHALFNCAYLIGGRIGDWVSALLCAWLPRPQYAGCAKPKALNAWLYHQAWREGGSHGPWPFYFRNVIASWRPDPDMPFLFLYGADGPKTLRFHTAHWRSSVTSIHHQSRELGLPGHHWFFLENPDVFYQTIDEFLAS